MPRSPANLRAYGSWKTASARSLSCARYTATHRAVSETWRIGFAELMAGESYLFAWHEACVGWQLSIGQLTTDPARTNDPRNTRSSDCPETGSPEIRVREASSSSKLPRMRLLARVYGSPSWHIHSMSQPKRLTVGWVCVFRRSLINSERASGVDQKVRARRCEST